MKERIAIEIRNNKCNNCSNDCKRRLEDKILCELRNNLTPKFNYQQVPETFDELKELCKGMFAEVSEHSIMLFGCLEFWDDGTLSFFHYSDITNNLTPAQMWQIIKNLIGEE